MTINLCYVLHSYPYQDNSLILQCFSLEQGLISFLSKGARSSKKNLLSLLQPFKLLSISFVGKGDLYTLTGVEQSTLLENLDDNASTLTGKSIYCAYYVNELLLRLLSKGEENTEVFALYQQTIDELLDKSRLEVVLRNFEIKLLNLLGYQPNLDVDIITGKPVIVGKNYCYDILSGPYETDLSLKKQAGNRFIISGLSLLSIKELNLDNSQVLKDSKYLLRQLLLCQLGDKPLKSREVYRQLYGN
jgi:DNA repair protein RecO (recombination protein O)